MGYKLIAQIVLIVTSCVIVFSFVLPTLNNIKTAQNELFQYENAVSKAAQYNARLQELVSIRDSFSPENLATLEHLIPSKIDKVAVMNNIHGIFTNQNIEVTSLIAQEEIVPVTDVVLEGVVQNTGLPQLAYQDYTVVFTASYDDLKQILMQLEASKTLFEVSELTFDSRVSHDPETEGSLPEGHYPFTLTLRAFGLEGSEQ